jgi:cobyrinic acid a,c-diamide synthase
MAGLLGVSTSFARRKLHLGYRIARLVADGCLGPRGTVLRGHEFHYASVVVPEPASVCRAFDDAPFAEMSDAHGGAAMLEGGRRGLVSGSFFHMIAASP